MTQEKSWACIIAGSFQMITGQGWKLLGASAFGGFGGVFIVVRKDDGGGAGGKSDSHYVNVGKILG